MDQTGPGETLPDIAVIRLDGLAQAIQSWRRGGGAQQFFTDQTGRAYVATFHRVETAGPAKPLK